MATAEFLTSRPGTEARAYVVGEGALVHALYQAGFTLSETDADFVVLGETRAYNFDMIQRAAQLVRRGARFIATNPDVAGPAGTAELRGLRRPHRADDRQGALLRGQAQRVHDAGRPAPPEGPLRGRLDGRGQHGHRHHRGRPDGLVTVLVLSGVSREEDLPRFAYRPDHIVADARALRELLARQPRAGGAPSTVLQSKERRRHVALKDRATFLTTAEQVDDFLAKNPAAAIFKAGTCHKTQETFAQVQAHLEPRGGPAPRDHPRGGVAPRQQPRRGADGDHARVAPDHPVQGRQGGLRPRQLGHHGRVGGGGPREPLRPRLAWFSCSAGSAPRPRGGRPGSRACLRAAGRSA